MRWAEARSRAGIEEEPYRTTTLALAQFRLERYSQALGLLQKKDLPALGLAAGSLMAPWNLLACYDLQLFWDPQAMTPKGMFVVDPIALIVRAMCHHRLGQAQEAQSCLHEARELLSKANGTGEPSALLREATGLIEGRSEAGRNER